MSSSTQKVSLSFSKKIEKKNLKTSALGNESLLVPEIKNKHSISSFDKDTKLPEPTKSDMIIPLVESKRESVFKKLQQVPKEVEKIKETPLDRAKSQDKELTLDEQAAVAVLEESTQKQGEFKNSRTDNELSIELNVLNSSSLDLDLSQDTGKISTIEEYEQVNVECFGAALLRGMGWNKEKGIGKTNKRIVQTVNPTSKAFALTNMEGKKNKDGEVGEEEEEEMKKGSQVLVHAGRNRGTYGTVEAVDEDHLLIRPARGEQILREVEQNIRVVSAKEYKELSRVINKEMYDEYKAAEIKRKEERKQEKVKDSFPKDSKRRKKEESVERERETSDDKKRKNDDDYERERNHRGENQLRTESRHGRNKEEYEKKMHKRDSKAAKKEDERGRRITSDKKDSKREETEMKEYKRSKEDRIKAVYDDRCGVTDACRRSSAMPVIPWARENLRVRIIDKEYKGGRYHKEKVIVRSVETVNSCTCVSDDGKSLYNVNPDHLETVIPKRSSAIVFVVKGKYKGQKGRTLEFDKEKEKATIQLLQDTSIIVKLHYDDICEYVAR